MQKQNPNDLKSSLFSQSGLAAAGTTIAGNGGMDHCFPFSRLPSPVCELTSDLSRAKVGSEESKGSRRDVLDSPVVRRLSGCTVFIAARRCLSRGPRL